MQITENFLYETLGRVVVEATALRIELQKVQVEKELLKASSVEKQEYGKEAKPSLVPIKA